MRSEPAILVADDDENDVLLLGRAFEDAKVRGRLMVVRNGQEAIDYLRGEGKYRDRVAHPWPRLMLLDLKMPMVNGFDVLTWWREEGPDRELPIVVMSSSNLESDMKKAMGLGAAGYQVKASDFQHLVAVARELQDKWLPRSQAA